MGGQRRPNPPRNNRPTRPAKICEKEVEVGSQTLKRSQNLELDGDIHLYVHHGAFMRLAIVSLINPMALFNAL